MIVNWLPGDIFRGSYQNAGNAMNTSTRRTMWIAVLTVMSALFTCSASVAKEPSKGEIPTLSIRIVPQADERPATLDTQKLDEAGRKLGGEIDRIGEKASPEIGAWINSKIYRGLTWFKLLFCFLLFVIVFIMQLLIRYWIRAFVRRVQNGKVPMQIIATYADLFLRPISLLIWVYGSYAALSPLFVYFEQADDANAFHSIMKKTAEIGGFVAVLWMVYLLVFVVDDQLKKKAPSGESFQGSLVFNCRAPLKLFVSLVLMRMLLPLFTGLPYLLNLLGNILAILLIVSVAWLMLRASLVIEYVILGYYKIDVKDNLMARRVQTQVRFFRRVVAAVVIVVAGASMLMLFEKVRQLGAGILTSAGIFGVVVGLAAQRSIANLLVGLQIAITQPIRIDDVVIIENEWGRIEEITSTYAVVRIWDQRRLIVPLTYFTEKVFQNWTRTSSELLGTVFIHTDYTVPMESLRMELWRILANSKSWDGKVWGLQVTDAAKGTLEIRALMSAHDASLAWDLRCEVREGLITYMQRNFPESLPKTRIDFLNPAKQKQAFDITYDERRPEGWRPEW